MWISLDSRPEIENFLSAHSLSLFFFQNFGAQMLVSIEKDKEIRMMMWD